MRLPGWRVGRTRLAAVGGVALVAGLLMPAVASAATAPGPVSSGPLPVLLSSTVTTPMSQASVSGQPVEVTADRTADSDTWALPDGEYRTEASPTPINYQNSSGSMVPVNDSLVADNNPVDAAAGYSLDNEADQFQVKLPSSLSSAPVMVQLSQGWVSFSLQGGAGTLSSSGSSATYTNALPGVNVGYTVTSAGLKETLVLGSASVPSSFSFSMATSSGLSLVAQSGGIDILSGSTVVGVLDTPTMLDAAGQSGPVAVSLSGSSGAQTLTVTPSASWLADPSRVFPVSVDPTVSVAFGEIWSLNANNPNTFYNGPPSTVQGTLTSGSARLPIHSRIGTQGLTSIPDDAIVTNATLSASVTTNIGSDTILARTISQASSNGTWNDAYVSDPTYGTVPWTVAGGTTDTTTPLNAAGFLATPSAGTATWYVTPMVQQWVQANGLGTSGDTHPLHDYGVLLAAENEGSTAYSASLSSFSFVVTWTPRLGKSSTETLDTHNLDDRSTIGVQVANGNEFLTSNDLNVAGVGINLAVANYYNSLGETGGAAWTFSVGPDMVADQHPDGSITFTLPSGVTEPFTEGSGTAQTCIANLGTGTSSFPSSEIAPPGADACAGTDDGGIALVDNSSQQTLLFGIDANGTTTNASGDPVYYLERIVDRNGDTVSFTYNTSHYLSKMTDTAGRIFDVSEDPTTHKISSIAGPEGLSGPQYRTWTWNWASNGQLTSYTDPTNATTDYYYDANGNLDQVTAPGQSSYSTGVYSALSSGGQVSQLEDASTACGGSDVCTTTTFTAAVAPQPVTAGTNRCNSYPAGNATQEVQPATMIGCATVTLSITGPGYTSQLTSYGFDVQDQVVKTVDALNQLTSTTRNADDQTTDSTDANGNNAVSTYSTDGYDNALTASANPSTGTATAAMSTDTYNSANTTATVAGPNGSTIAGSQYMPASSTDPESNCSASSYDGSGNMTSIETGISASGTGSGRSCAQGAPSGSEAMTQATYQGDTPPGGPTVTCGGFNGEVCSTTTGNGAVTAYRYNSSGELTKVTPPSPNQPTTITYDGLGRKKTVTDGAGRTTSYSYDKDDRVTVVDANAVNDPTCATAADCVQATYDPNGDLVTQIDGTGTDTKTYNYAGQVLTDSQPTTTLGTCGSSGATVVYTYTTAGKLASMCDAGGTVTYTYNARNENTGVADPGGSCTSSPITQPCTTIGYSPTGFETTITYPSGTGITETRTPDDANEVMGIQAGTATSPGSLVNLSYVYSGGTPTADLAQRQSVTDHDYSGGTGLTTTYQYNSSDTLAYARDTGADTKAYHYTYDQDGNILTQAVNTTVVSAAYNADDETCWTYSGSSAAACANPPTGANTTGNTYNGAGDQTGIADGTNTFTETFNNFDQTNGVTPNGGITTGWTYIGVGQDGLVTDGANTLENTALGVSAQINSTGSTYFTRDANGNLLDFRTGSATTYYVLDANNSVAATFDGSGTIKSTCTYTPYGVIRIGGGTNCMPSGTANPFYYDSGYVDTVTGLIHFGARYYDPSIGRWTQLDPSGKDAGYAFAGDNPVNATDPSGDFQVYFDSTQTAILGAVFLSSATYEAGASAVFAIGLPEDLPAFLVAVIATFVFGQIGTALTTIAATGGCLAIQINTFEGVPYGGYPFITNCDTDPSSGEHGSY